MQRRNNTARPARHRTGVGRCMNRAIDPTAARTAVELQLPETERKSAAPRRRVPQERRPRRRTPARSRRGISILCAAPAFRRSDPRQRACTVKRVETRVLAGLHARLCREYLRRRVRGPRVRAEVTDATELANPRASSRVRIVGVMMATASGGRPAPFHPPPCHPVQSPNQSGVPRRRWDEKMVAPRDLDQSAKSPMRLAQLHHGRPRDAET